MLVSLSCVAIVIGVLGTQCHKYFCSNFILFPVLFGITLFMVWLSVLVIGVIVFAVSDSGPVVIQGFCDGEPLYSELDPLIDQIYIVDT